MNLKKILLVDDEMRLRRLVRMTLGDEFSIFEAGDGREGIEVAKAEQPDMIFLDVQMPEMDGFATCAAIKEDPALADIPVVMLTGMTDTEYRQKGTEAGVDDYFVKPFSPRELLDKVYETLGEPDF